MSLLPEIKLKKILDHSLDVIRKDYYDSLPNEQNSFLYKVFGENVIDNYNFFIQAKTILLKTNDNPRLLQTRVFFDRSRAHIPTIHINLPSETPNGDSLGYGLGNVDPLFDDINEEYSLSRQRCFNTTFNITVTSDNTHEIIIIYTILKAIMISIVEILEMNGLRNPKISARDLMILDTTPPLYMRVLALEVWYEFNVPGLDFNKIVNQIDFTPTYSSESVIGEETTVTQFPFNIHKYTVDLPIGNTTFIHNLNLEPKFVNFFIGNQPANFNWNRDINNNKNVIVIENDDQLYLGVEVLILV